MKRLREDVDEFYRLRVIVTFRSGRTHQDIYGPFTKQSKARELRTRVADSWGFVWSPKRRNDPLRDPNTQVESIRYITEILPSFGWHVKTDDTITGD